jgi:hypothetical protein
LALGGLGSGGLGLGLSAYLSEDLTEVSSHLFLLLPGAAIAKEGCHRDALLADEFFFFFFFDFPRRPWIDPHT